MASDERRVRPEDVDVLAGLAGLSPPAEDLEPLADALNMHLEFTAALANVDVRDIPAAMTFDPRWRD